MNEGFPGNFLFKQKITTFQILFYFFVAIDRLFSKTNLRQFHLLSTCRTWNIHSRKSASLIKENKNNCIFWSSKCFIILYYHIVFKWVFLFFYTSALKSTSCIQKFTQLYNWDSKYICNDCRVICKSVIRYQQTYR